MKAFQFSLEQILELRIEEEQEAEIRLGRAVSEWNRFNRDREDREAKKRGITPGLTPEDILQTSLYLARLDQEIDRFQQAMDQRAPLLEKLRREYTEARAARQGLEKLKEKRLNEHRKKAHRKEALILDDLSMNMIRMRKASE